MKYTMFFRFNKSGKEMFTCSIHNEQELIEAIQDLSKNNKGTIQTIVANKDGDLMTYASIEPLIREPNKPIYFKEY